MPDLDAARVEAALSEAAAAAGSAWGACALEAETRLALGGTRLVRDVLPRPELLRFDSLAAVGKVSALCLELAS